MYKAEGKQIYKHFIIFLVKKLGYTRIASDVKAIATRWG